MISLLNCSNFCIHFHCFHSFLLWNAHSLLPSSHCIFEESPISNWLSASFKTLRTISLATYQRICLVNVLDIVFCRTWYPVTCPKYYNPVSSLLLSKDSKNNWTGMRSVGEMRKELGLKAEFKSDSLYKVCIYTAVVSVFYLLLLIDIPITFIPTELRL